MSRRKVTALFALLASLASPLAFAASEGAPQADDKSARSANTPYFRITVVDEETGRGIPLVKLTTTNSTEYWTDSAGMVAFLEPEMMGAKVQMDVETYGYSMPRSGFGRQVIGFVPKAGEKMVVKLHRDAIAQRLYRLTGTDIYRDSRILGDKTPVTQDPSPMPVVGMDSVVTAVYHGKMYWIWGDTGITATNLGNFRSTGATSDLPGKGLDPEVGVYYTFFRNPGGRVQAMVNTDHNLTWLGGMHVVRDKAGKEHLFTGYSKIKPPMSIFEAGLAEFNDKTNQYDILWSYPADANLRLGACHFRHSDNGQEYFYQTFSVPGVRCRANLDAIKDIYSYEGLTCLKEGSKFDGSAEQLVRDQQGNLVWGWRRNTSVVGPREVHKLIANKLATAADMPYALRESRTGEAVMPHGGSVYWNEYRQRWVACILQTFGTSWLGEVWYFEGDTPVGPWVYGDKIITHTIFRKAKRGGRRVDEAEARAAETYGFYNVKHHPEFDKDHGRAIYLEGTYTRQFSGATQSTPRYNYNQMLYKLELDDPRLRLPVPVYRVSGNDGDAGAEHAGYYTKTDVPKKVRLDGEAVIAFFAPDRQRRGTVPVYQVRQAKSKGVRLTLQKPAGDANPAIAFYAGAPEASSTAASDALKAAVPLYEYLDPKTGERLYSVKQSIDAQDARIDDLPADAGRFQRADKPICRVWPNPIRFNPHRLTP